MLDNATEHTGLSALALTLVLSYGNKALAALLLLILGRLFLPSIRQLFVQLLWEKFFCFPPPLQGKTYSETQRVINRITSALHQYHPQVHKPTTKLTIRLITENPKYSTLFAVLLLNQVILSRNGSNTVIANKIARRLLNCRNNLTLVDGLLEKVKGDDSAWFDIYHDALNDIVRVNVKLFSKRIKVVNGYNHKKQQKALQLSIQKEAFKVMLTAILPLLLQITLAKYHLRIMSLVNSKLAKKLLSDRKRIALKMVYKKLIAICKLPVRGLKKIG